MIYDYPRSAAGLLVVKRGHVLLLERAHPPRVGYLDVPGGFMEAGETLEGGARRELREETGLTLGRVDSLGFYWDTYAIKGFGRFPVMNFYFAGRWRRGEPVAADDAASAAWVPIAHLPRLRGRFAWAHMTPLLKDLTRWERRGRRPAARVPGAEHAFGRVLSGQAAFRGSSRARRARNAAARHGPNP